MYCIDCKYCELKEKYHRGEDWCKKYNDACDHNIFYYCEKYKPNFFIRIYNLFSRKNKMFSQRNLKLVLNNISTVQLDRVKPLLKYGCKSLKCECCPFYKTILCSYIKPSGGLKNDCEIKLNYAKHKIIIKDFSIDKD